MKAFLVRHTVAENINRTFPVDIVWGSYGTRARISRERLHRIHKRNGRRGAKKEQKAEYQKPK